MIISLLPLCISLYILIFLIMLTGLWLSTVQMISRQSNPSMCWYGCSVSRPLLPHLCCGEGFSISPLSHSLQVFCTCSDLIVWAGSSLEDVAVCAAVGEPAVLGALSPESWVSGGFNLCFPLRYLWTLPPAAVRWELGVMSTEHSSTYFVATQSKSCF